MIQLFTPGAAAGHPQRLGRPLSLRLPAGPPAPRSVPMPPAKLQIQLAARTGRLGNVAAAPPLGLPTLLVVGLMVLLAATLAPEHPQDQAAICQRHNGPVACRVL